MWGARSGIHRPLDPPGHHGAGCWAGPAWTPAQWQHPAWNIPTYPLWVCDQPKAQPIKVTKDLRQRSRYHTVSLLIISNPWTSLGCLTGAIQMNFNDTIGAIILNRPEWRLAAL